MGTFRCLTQNTPNGVSEKTNGAPGWYCPLYKANYLNGNGKNCLQSSLQYHLIQRFAPSESANLFQRKMFTQ
jgi:hypothetical protein